jgi:hypothetical protein
MTLIRLTTWEGFRFIVSIAGRKSEEPARMECGNKHAMLRISSLGVGGVL